MNESLSLQFAQRLLWSSAPFLQGSLLHLLSQSSLLIELIHCHLACVLAKKVFNLLAIFEHGAHIEWSHAEVFCKIVNILYMHIIFVVNIWGNAIIYFVMVSAALFRLKEWRNVNTAIAWIVHFRPFRAVKIVNSAPISSSTDFLLSQC